MRTDRRLTFQLFAVICCAALAPCAPAQTTSAFPGRAVRIIVPFAAGGPSDLLARLFGQKLSESWGQPVVIENRGGANGVVGSELAARSAADGRTLVMGTNGTHGINASLFPKLPYDTINDFAPITRFAQVPFILVVHPSLPARSVKDLLELARARPGEITCSAGGSPSQLAAELFKSMARVNFLVVPYKGSSLALNDAVAGQVSLNFSAPAIALSQIRAGRLRGLGVTGTRRSPAAPEIATIAESGVPGFETTTWYGILAPGGTPPAIVDQLSSTIAKIAQQSDVRERLLAQSFEPLSDTPAQFAAIIAGELKKWAKVVKDSGIRPE